MIAAREILVNWHGPFKPREFMQDDCTLKLKSNFDKPGVYIWVESASRITLSYVGKASGSPTLFQRQRQHYANMIGGLYTIPAEFRNSGKPWVPDWSLPEVAEVMLNPLLFHDLVDEAYKYMDKTVIYLAPLETAENAAVAERQLLYDLQPTGTKRGLNSPPRNPVVIRHNNAIWIKETNSAQFKAKILLV